MPSPYSKNSRTAATRTPRASLAGLSALFLGASGCAPGHISWRTGDDEIRTALFAREQEGTADHLVVFLSNGEMPDPVDKNDAAAVAEASARALDALCREDARHVLLDLWLPRKASVVGSYPGDSSATAGDPTSPERWSTGLYIGMDEVAVSDKSSLNPAYEIVSEDVEAVGDGASVEVRDGKDGLKGRFDLGSADVSGDFRATFCEPGDGEPHTLGTAFLCEVLTDDPASLAPFLGSGCSGLFGTF